LEDLKGDKRYEIKWRKSLWICELYRITQYCVHCQYLLPLQVLSLLQPLTLTYHKKRVNSITKWGPFVKPSLIGFKIKNMSIKSLWFVTIFECFLVRKFTTICNL
jgi:hypothetical protein